ncbi:MAG TPA: DUF4173 domain-containing protein [Syntrophomonadaceae bacterium]|nr:DUF4173 domain-containing protein [Syntrophomonadaceae bacterium]HPR94408.1 DUF4173 domain-containing protein [Syntrophomonadaceae bacterium]
MNEYSEDNNGLSLNTKQPEGGIPRASIRAAEPFEADRKDGIFALLAFVLGFCFAHWVLFSWQGWGVTMFTLGYCGIITVYLLKKGVHIPRAGWFWLTIVVLTGISFSLWTNNGLAPWPELLLFGSAIYWITCAAGLPILGKTSNLIGLDIINTLVVIPIKNFGCQYKSLAFLGRNRKTESRQVFSVALGLVLTFIVAAMVLPLLMNADSGGFARITNGFLTFLHGIKTEAWETLVYGILAIPTGAYIFGLAAGSVHKRGCDTFEKDRTLKFFSGMQILPSATVYTLLGLLCTLYVIFIGSQLPYFFSAFIGERPEGWQVYSEYARSGFFELCSIAAINLTVLTAANLLSQRQYRDSMALKILNSLLAMLTLILIATALSKMVMYIGAYGLSMRRLLPCMFMIFLAVLCGGVVALQKWPFSIARLAAGVGVVMLCLLCLINPDSIVAGYNAERYLSGTLKSFDVEILYRSGPAGVDSALKLYEHTDDNVLQGEITKYLFDQKQALQSVRQPQDCVQTIRARQKIEDYSL